MSRALTASRWSANPNAAGTAPPRAAVSACGVTPAGQQPCGTAGTRSQTDGAPPARRLILPPPA